MSRILDVSNTDYRVIVQTGGYITLDTGGTGTVIVDGNLTVIGATTNLETTNTIIEDNIIVLNNGEGGSVVTKGSSGIQIDRGSSADPQFLFDETLDWYDPQSNSVLHGEFVTKRETGELVGLRTISITAGANDLSLIGSGLGESTTVVTVKGTIDYETRVLNYSLPGYPAFDDDIIPNIKAVIDHVEQHVPVKIQDYKLGTSGETLLSDSKLQIYDFDTTGFASKLSLELDGIYNAGWYSDRHEVQNIVISINQISTLLSNQNLILTSTNKLIEVNGVLSLDDQSGTVSPQPGTTKILSKSSLGNTPGKTGIFFANDISSDELVAKNRALLFSMLF